MESVEKKDIPAEVVEKEQRTKPPALVQSDSDEERDPGPSPF